MRKIIHCDCDCFFAAVEERDQPALRGHPVAVGGASSRRGVVATCNYAAREFGVRSAMPMARALRLCPRLIVIPTDMPKYRMVSQQIAAIFRDYTALIEPLSLDEAYLDVTHSRRCQGSATLMAAEIRQRVRETLGITLSAGVAPNKFLAKIASDWNKPDGQFVILPEQVEDFVLALPVARLPGVGQVTAARLHATGATDCAALRDFDETQLVATFGRFGSRLYWLCRGVDEREVRAERVRKSLSVETTYARDLPDLAQCRAQLLPLARQLARRWRPLRADYEVRSAFVKLRFDDFRATTVERSLAETAQPGWAQLLQQYFEPLLVDGWHRAERPVRLLGLGFRLQPATTVQQQPSVARQLPLFDD